MGARSPPIALRGSGIRRMSCVAAEGACGRAGDGPPSDLRSLGERMRGTAAVRQLPAAVGSVGRTVPPTRAGGASPPPWAAPRRRAAAWVAACSRRAVTARSSASIDRARARVGIGHRPRAGRPPGVGIRLARRAPAAIGLVPHPELRPTSNSEGARKPGPLRFSACRVDQLIFVIRSSGGGEIGLWAMKYRPRASTSTSPPS